MIKLPRTLHIEGSGLATAQDPDVIKFNKLNGEFLVIEEKLDGTGVSLFFDDNLKLQIYHRGSPAIGKEFNRLVSWAQLNQDKLFDILESRYVLFGEWMLYKHTIFYDKLPSFFLESDVYDKKEECWLSTFARNTLLSGHELVRSVPVIAAFKPTKLNQITSLIKRSLYQSERWAENLWDKCDQMGLDLNKVIDQCDRSDLSEGLYIKHEDENKVIGRYKFVRSEFIEKIINSGTHIKDRIPINNISVQGDLI